ncbi:MAG: radical SAM family heme chaperone HemW [Candidatus Gastranaerophilales bacterium]|nr:radical SAM family heme chaperone HemW [Candidatus Gastranaerophilales bacterium]
MVNCVYLHIPFCEKKCKYCAFCSFGLLSKKEIYLNSLTKEIKELYKGEILKTIYFGGGTPSLLDVKDIKNILNLFNFNSKTEITLELNPHLITKEKLLSLKEVGINRLSIGVQSFDNEILSEIGRTHSAKEIYKTIENIKEIGFENFSIDLMYGLPNQTLEIWEETLKKALEINPAHISLYGLKIEDGTYYSKHLPKNLPDDDMQAKMYELAIEILSKNYIHYEFSNFAKEEKYFSNHNLCYWNCKNYYGFGLSASGYIENKRYTNTFNFSEYIKNPTKKDYETLTTEEQIEEEIFLGLRKTKGIDFEKINEKFDIDIYEKYKKEFDKFLANGLMQKTQNGIKLTQKGILISNEILCDFIQLND